VSALVAQARVDLQSNKIDAAIEGLENAQKIKSDHPEVLFLLGIATQNQAQIEMRMGDGPDVEDMFMKSASISQAAPRDEGVHPAIRSQAAVAIYNEACVHSVARPIDQSPKGSGGVARIRLAETKANADTWPWTPI